MRTRLLALAVLAAASCGDDTVHHLTDAPPVPLDAPGPDAGPVDLDHDGFTSDVDCNDHDATVHPGALDACAGGNGTDDDCDGMIDEAATFDDGTGPVDVAATLAAGTSTTPVAYTPPAAGVLALCNATYFVHITATADLEVAGRAMATTIIDGALTGTPLVDATAGTTLTVHDVTLTHGAATALDGDVGCNVGGALACLGPATLHANHVTLSASSACYGGGLASANCTTDLTDAIVTGNQAASVATAGGGVGGGIAALRGTTTVTRTSITANTTDNVGSAVSSQITGTGVDLVDSTVSGNTGGTEGALYTESNISCTTSAITANQQFGVVLAGGGATFSSASCDFGVGAQTNTPHDIGVGAGFDYGAAASFTCTNTTCN